MKELRVVRDRCMGPTGGHKSFEGLFSFYENLSLVDVIYRAREGSSFE